MSRGLLSARLQTVTRSHQPSHTTGVVDRDDDLLPDPCRAPVRTIFQSPAGFDQLTNRSSKFMPLFLPCLLVPGVMATTESSWGQAASLSADK